MMRRSSFLLPLTAALAASCAPPPPTVTAAGPCAAREAVNPATPLPYSESVKGGGLVHFAGKIGVTDQTRTLSSGRVEAETRNILESFRAAFATAGVGFEDVLNATVYLADIRDFDEMNRVYAGYFPQDPPARATVAVAGLPGGAAVEISFVALCR